MSTDNTSLVPVDMSQLPSVQVGSDEVFDEMSQGGDFLGRLQLYSKGTAINKGLIGVGRWGIPENAEQIIDLGDKIDIIPFARRPKALDMSDKEAIITNYDATSDEFKRIQSRSSEQNSGCMFGVSFLILERSSGRFLEFFCGTKSTRSEAKKIFPFLALTQPDIAARGLTGVEPHGPLPCTLDIRLVERKSFSWHVPVVSKCSSPFTSVPAIERIAAEMTRFCNPSDEGTEKVDEKSAENQRAR